MPLRLECPVKDTSDLASGWRKTYPTIAGSHVSGFAQQALAMGTNNSASQGDDLLFQVEWEKH